MNKITFDQLPEYMVLLCEKVDKIEQLITGQSSTTSAHEGDLMNITQVAEFLTLKIPTIYSKVSRNELPYMKDKHRVYFSKTELTAFLKSKTVRTQQEKIENAHENIGRK
jgi:excisionase family DNA binding protein